MDLLFDLPAHPLLVHAPVVLLPLFGVTAIVLAVRADWRTRIGWWFTAGLGAIVVMLFLARESGEALEEAFDGAVDVSDHSSLADQTFVLAIVWFVVTAGLAFRDRQVRVARDLSAATADRRDPIALGLAVVAAVLAVVTTIWLIRTGHTGAESHWAPAVRFFED